MSARGMKRRLVSSVLAVSLVLVLCGVLADWGPVHALECRMRTWHTLQFELPEQGTVTLGEFRRLVDVRSYGCASVTVWSGSTADEALVVQGGGRTALDYGEHEVFVSTEGVGVSPPTTAGGPNP
jgi:hypothetical protein